MDLNAYLSSPGALSVSQLLLRMQALGYGVKSDAQIRQWRTRYKGRIPSAENCTAIERATSGMVSRQDLRPNDWHQIWPELAERPSALQDSS